MVGLRPPNIDSAAEILVVDPLSLLEHNGAHEVNLLVQALGLKCHECRDLLARLLYPGDDWDYWDDWDDHRQCTITCKNS